MPRLFVGFPVPSVILLELQRKFSSFDLAFPKSFHMTFKFLGDVENSKISAIIQRLQQVRAPQLTFSFSHLGTFSNFEGLPRVLWVALRPEEPLLKLHEQVEQFLQELFPRDKSYQPHVTLGRFTSSKHLSVLPSVLKMTLPSFPFLIKEFYLYKSEQQPNGIYKHSILSTIPLHS